MAGSQSLRVSYGSDRPAVGLRRDFEGKIPAPANEVPGLRDVSKTPKLAFRKFRRFGIQRAGAVDATGAPLPQR